MNDNYSWVKTHKEITKFLISKEDKQLELIQLLKSIGITPFNDKSKNSEGIHDIELQELLISKFDMYHFLLYI